MDDRKQYSPEDDENFEKLMDFPDAHTIRTEKEKEQIISPVTQYSEADNRAFDQLMNSSVSAGVVRKRSSSSNSFLVDGYSDHDSGLFDALESSIDDSRVTSQTHYFLPDQKQAPKIVKASKDDSFEYSLTDKQAFSRLMEEGFGEGDDQVSELEIRNQISETSHIKIIDFDKENAREKSVSRFGKSHIKIRYFD
jgi:hypothetical protein